MASPQFLDDIVRGIGGFFEAVTPIDLFNQQQTAKLSYTFSNALQNPSMKNFRTYAGEVGQAVGAAQARYSAAGRPMNMAEYFQGYKFDRAAATFTPGELATNRAVRIGAAASLAAYGASSMVFGEDSIPAKVSGGALGMAVHGGIAKALYTKTHPMIGVAYGGLGLVNMMRKGDNLGPF